MAEELDYVPMPKKVVAEIEKMWASEIKDSGGKPLHAAHGALGSVQSRRGGSARIVDTGCLALICCPVCRMRLCGGRLIV